MSKKICENGYQPSPTIGPFMTRKDAINKINELNASNPNNIFKYYVYYYTDEERTNKEYLICDYEYFKKYSSMMAQEREDLRLSKRCQFISDRYKNTLVLCQHNDCRTCPHKNKVRFRPNGEILSADDNIVDIGDIASLDEAFDMYELEVSEKDNLFYNDNLSNLKDRELVNRILSNLNEEDRYIIEQTLMYKVSSAKVGAVLGIPASTVRDRKYQILKKLKEFCK